MAKREVSATGRPDSRAAALTLVDVAKQFRSGQRVESALVGVTLQVPVGKIIGLIGPDGAGKTTLMRLVAGLLTIDAGTITVLGLDVRADPLAVQSTVGYMPQRFGLYEDLTVQENLDLYADLQGVPRRLRAGRYEELMHMTGLAPFTGRLAGRLSGGMKQKLGLACTLVHPPKLLLLDEPTVGVDPVSRRELWQIVDRFVREEGTTVLLSTAYLDEAERCDELIILHEGRLLGHGPPGQFTAPLTGRTFQVHVPHMKNRDVEERLAFQSGVVDAVILGDAVRLVLAEPVRPAVHEWLAGESDVSVSPVPPRFEDAFIAMLGGRDSNGSRLQLDTASRPADDRISGARADAAPARRLVGAGQRRGLLGRLFGLHRGTRTSPPSDLVIQVRDVQRRFGDFYAVKGVTFDVHRGEVFGLLGANGAGKTTTFRMLCGLLPASSGQLSVAGVDVRRTAAAARARIGYMSQKFSLYGTLSVADNLRFFSSAYGLAGRRRAARMKWASDQFELAPVLDSMSGALPLGYKQRLALACALMHQPEILFLDEPTSGVDPLARREFWHRINALARQGVTVLVTTHFMEEAEYCDRMAIMVRGEILALGTPPEIKQSAVTPENPAPTMETAFIHLIESHDQLVAS